MLNFKELRLSALMGLVSEAKTCSRHRKTFNLHESYSDNCQKVINAIHEDSYIAPHRHSLDPKVETLIALQGCFALITFNSGGTLEDAVKFGSPDCHDDTIACFGVEVFPETWHTVIALRPNSILLEIKDGPFIPSLGKDFAHWAPLEDSIESKSYLRGLKIFSNSVKP